VFVPGTLSQFSLMFAGKAGAYPNDTPLDSPLEGSFLTLPTNIRLGWKILPGTNTLAYLKKLLIMGVKCFISSSPGVYVLKLFSSSHAIQNKLECLPVPSVFLIKWSLLV